MTHAISDMTDLAFELQGDSLPRHYSRALWEAVMLALPWAGAAPGFGLLPIKGSVNGSQLLLPRRARLVLRLPVERVEEAQELSGQPLEVGDQVLAVGASTLRPHQGHPTLHAHLVASDRDEAAFMEEVADALGLLGIAGNWICGRQHALQDEQRPIQGYSLVVHHLKPEQSLLLQGRGMGEYRHLGCGIFIPYKAIPNLE
jgi:CRISPR-associated protein Cas6